MDHRSFSVPCLRTLIMRQNAVVKLVSRSVVLLLTNNNSNTWGADLLIYGVLTRIKFIQTKTKKKTLITLGHSITFNDRLAERDDQEGITAHNGEYF